MERWLDEELTGINCRASVWFLGKMIRWADEWELRIEIIRAKCAVRTCEGGRGG